VELRQLAYFLKAVELKSISKAAERSHIAQPALGLHLRKLERELGVPLLNRHTRGVEPTEAGALLRRHAQELLDHADRIKQELLDFKGPARGTIRLGLCPSINLMLAAGLVKRCKADYPKVSLDIIESVSADLIDWVGQGRLDLAVAYSVDGVAGEPLLVQDFFFVGSPKAMAPSREPITLAEVARHSVIIAGTEQGARHLFERPSAAAGITLDIGMQVTSVLAVKELVEQGFGCALLPYGVVRHNVEEGTMFARRIVDPPISRPIHLVCSPRRPLSKAGDAIRRIIHDLVRAHGGESSCRSPERRTARTRAKRR
jgi:LysR family nitrogen assimilation transcriptional regulator